MSATVAPSQSTAERRHVGRRVREILKDIQGHPTLSQWEQNYADSIADICTRTHEHPAFSDKQLALLLKLHDRVTGRFSVAANVAT